MSLKRWILVVKICTLCAAVGVASGILVGGMCLIPYHHSDWLEGLRGFLYLLSWLPTMVFFWLWVMRVYGVTFVLSLAGIVVGVIARPDYMLLRWSIGALVCHVVLVVVNAYIYLNLSEGSVLHFARQIVWPSRR